MEGILKWRLSSEILGRTSSSHQPSGKPGLATDGGFIIFRSQFSRMRNLLSKTWRSILDDPWPQSGAARLLGGGQTSALAHGRERLSPSGGSLSVMGRTGQLW